jgi:hypothetical protein
MTTFKKTTRQSKNPTAAARAVLRAWAEADRELRSGPKTFLMHLASHANEDGESYVLSRHFQRLMNVSPRTVTNYLRQLEAKDYIVETASYLIVRSTRFPYYRIAPGVTEIDELVNRSEDFAAREAGQPGNSVTPLSTLSSHLGKPCSAYNKINSNDSNNSTDSSVAASVNTATEKLLRMEGSDWEAAMEGLPAEVLEDLPSHCDQEWQNAWLAPCLWRETDRTLKAPHSLAGKELIRWGGYIFKAAAIRVTWNGRDEAR